MIGPWEEPEFPMHTLLNCETVGYLGMSFPQSKLINKRTRYTIEQWINYFSVKSSRTTWRCGRPLKWLRRKWWQCKKWGNKLFNFKIQILLHSQSRQYFFYVTLFHFPLRKFGIIWEKFEIILPITCYYHRQNSRK